MTARIGCEHPVDRGYRDRGVGVLDDLRVALADDGDHVGAAGAYLLDVGGDLLQHRGVGGDAHHGGGLVEQGDRAVLHLAGGVGVGGDVGDLLELQRALQRDRQPDVAADVEEELSLPVLVGDAPDLVTTSASGRGGRSLPIHRRSR